MDVTLLLLICTNSEHKGPMHTLTMHSFQWLTGIVVGKTTSYCIELILIFTCFISSVNNLVVALVAHLNAL